MAAHDARAVANEILSIAHGGGRFPTLMQLIKLVYLANGWWLSYSGGRPLTNTQAQAWQYGPVHPHVYKAFKRHGSLPIRALADDPQTGMPYASEFTAEERQLLKGVVDSYGDMHAFKLSNIMHQPETPWSKTIREHGPYAPIPNDLIQEHYDEIKRNRSP